MFYDVHIIGGGPAGLSAALWLGRACRSVLVSDAGKGRNSAAIALHGFPTRDGIEPAEFRKLSHRELRKYAIDVRTQKIERVRLSVGPNGARRFVAQSGAALSVSSRKLVLATGVRDQLPRIAGLEEWFGRGVFHCPYCDAWEHRGERLVAYGRGEAGVGLGLMLRTWSRYVWVCSGAKSLGTKQQRRLRRNGVRWLPHEVSHLVGGGGKLQRIVFEDGHSLDCDALFFNTAQIDRSGLAWQLGCKRTPDGCVRCDDRGRTGVPGLFLAGDASHEVQFIVTAAADGARAAVAINRELQNEERDPGN